jgi:hypothetical protein
VIHAAGMRKAFFGIAAIVLGLLFASMGGFLQIVGGVGYIAGGADLLLRRGPITRRYLLIRGAIACALAAAMAIGAFLPPGTSDQFSIALVWFGIYVGYGLYSITKAAGYA